MPHQTPAFHGRRVRMAHALLHARLDRGENAVGPSTLSIDIGGTGIKMLVLDRNGGPLGPRTRSLTPQPSLPEAVLGVIAEMLPAQQPYHRVSVGFPGVVIHGIVHTAPNLGTEAWQNFLLEDALRRLCGAPTSVINDADLQGYGVIDGRGVELVLTLGTGLGSALFVDGRLVPNLELGHHPFKKGKTYEERVSDSELKRIGKREWSERVIEMLDQLAPIFNYDTLHLGGGNVEHIKHDLPDNVRIFSNVDGMTGGIRLWSEDGG